MATKQTDATTTDPSPKADKGTDAGQAEVQRRSDEATEKGYFGTVPPGPANEEYSLESGPDSPSAYDLRKEARK
jgi:hypothetical protein